MIRSEYQKETAGLPFVMYMPENVKGDLPLILQLHGAGEWGNGGDELSRVESYGFVDIFRNEEIDCILVLPQCPPESFWVAELNAVHDLILKLMEMFPINNKKVYLTGLSMGGYGTWYTATRYPKMFAAIAPICGGGMTWKATDFDMPVWAFHGIEDDVVPPNESIQMINAIRKYSNEDVRLTIFDKVGHGSWEPAYNKELLGWLLSKSR